MMIRQSIFQTLFRRTLLGIYGLCLLGGGPFFPVIPAYGQDTMPQGQEGDPLEPVLLKGGLFKEESYPIDLPTVLQLVETQNLSLSQSVENSNMIRSRFFYTASEFLPDVSFDYNQSRFQGGIQIFGGATVPVFRTTYQPQVTASWTLYPGGKTLFETLAAKKRHTSSKSLVQETYQQQMARAAEEFYTYVEALLQQRVALTALEESKNETELAYNRYQAGVGTKLDWMRAKTLQSQQEQLLIEARSTIAKSEQTLLNRLNLDTRIHLLPIHDEPRAKRLVPESLATETLLKEALENHPFIRQQQLDLKALKADFKAIFGSYLPAVTLQAYSNWTGPSLQELQQGRFAGLNVHVNLLENLGLALPSRLLEKHHEIQKKEFELAQAIRDIETRVVHGVLDSESMEQAIGVTTVGEESSEEAYRLAEGRYKAGVGTHLDVLEAEKDMTQARQDKVSAILDYNRSQIRLLEALGQITPSTVLEGFKHTGSPSPNGNTTHDPDNSP